MKEFEEFLKNGVIKKQHPDKPRAMDLLEEADRKFKNIGRIIGKIGIDNENSNDIVESCSDIVLGIIRSKMLVKGFSASGKGAHEAEVAFSEKLGFNEKEIDFTNKLRYFRNRILYYGKKFDKEYAEKVYDFISKMRRKLLK